MSQADTEMQEKQEKQEKQEEQEENKEKQGPKIVYAAFTAAAWIILIHELLERFSFYGAKGILTYYLHDFIGFDEDTSTIIYHLFTGISYLTPLIGTFMSDNFAGRYKTIVILGIVYLIGHALMPITAIWRNTVGPLLAMLVLAIGTGGIKPCVAAFGGDQIEPGNERVLDAFFSVFYMCINIGAFASQLLTPILREQVKCVGEDSCYPLAFGVPAVAFALAYILFLVGTPKYKIYPKPASPMLNRALKVIFTGKLWRRNQVTPDDDTAEDRAFLHDVRQAVQVCFLFLPLPIYWALFDQQGSRWVLQGRRMDGYISEGLSLTADQMQSVNPLLIVLVVPIFNNIIYPLFAKCNALKSATSRIFWGYIVCALAFSVTGLMDVLVDSTQPEELPATQAKLHMFNGNDCPVTVAYAGSTKEVRPLTLETFDDWKVTLPKGSNATEGEFLRVIGACANSGAQLSVKLKLLAGSTNLVIVHDSFYTSAMPIPYSGSQSRIRMAYGTVLGQNDSVRFVRDGLECLPRSNFSSSDSSLPSNDYCQISSRQRIPLLLDDKEVYQVSLEGGIRYVTVFAKPKADGGFDYIDIVDRQLNPPHILLQLPQYLLMCMSEVLTSVTALAYAYSEAPESLKALLQTAYLISIFFGNMIVIAVAALPRLPKQAYEFFLFAGLVFIGGFVQLLVIHFYKKMRAKNESLQQRDPNIELKSGSVVELDVDAKGKLNSAFVAIDDETAGSSDTGSGGSGNGSGMVKSGKEDEKDGGQTGNDTGNDTGSDTENNGIKTGNDTGNDTENTGNNNENYGSNTGTVDV